MKKALITGVLGQDGSYLAEYLHGLGYKVFGTTRRNPQTSRWIKQLDFVQFLYADMRDELDLTAAVHRAWPDEIYNLAGQVFVPVSWNKPTETFDVNTAGLARILRIVETVKPDTRVYQAGSSEMYGNGDGKCNEATPFNPVSPYGVSKYAAHRLVSVYREKGAYVVGGILFNHESPRRGLEMVTQKIATHVAGWALGDRTPLPLGNMEARRDWGFSGDYVKAMHLMLQAETPKDYVVGTGVDYSVQEWLDECVHAAKIPFGEVEQLILIDKAFVRENEIKRMRADYSAIERDLGWRPEVTAWKLADMMVTDAVNRLREVSSVKTANAQA